MNNLNDNNHRIMLLVGILFGIFLAVCSILGFVGYSIYSAMETARVAKQEQRLAEEKQRKIVQEEQQRAMDAERQAMNEKRQAMEAERQQELLAERELNIQRDAEMKAAEEVRRRQLAEAEEAQRQINLKQQQAQEELRRKQTEFQSVRLYFSDISAGLKRWKSGVSDEPIVPNSGGKGSRLSWRVHLLPYLGYEALYKEFHLDEPWDSQHNLTLVPKMPGLYGMKNGMARLRSCLPIDGENPMLAGQVTDGLSQTACVFWVPATSAVNWTTPDSLNPMKVDELGDLNSTPFVFLRADRTSVELPQADNTVLAALASPSGGEHIDDETLSNNGSGGQLLVATAAIGKNDTALSSEEAEENIHQIAGALYKWIEALKYPDAQKALQEGKLSWRVHLLPYLGEVELYKKFRLHEPWNSANNASLIEFMPKVYGAGASPGRSRIQAISTVPIYGNGPPKELMERGVNLSNHACLFYSAPQNAATWTTTRWAHVSPNNLHSILGWPAGTTLIAGFADGNSKTLPENLHLTKISALLALNNQPKFNLNEALQSPRLPLKIEVPVQPAGKIAGLRQLPIVQIPNGGLKPPTPMDVASQKRLRTLGLAIHNYESRFRRSPSVVKRPSGSPSGLSWRVHILPMIDQGTLFEKFALDEPWDSPTNSKLLEFMPEVFRNVESKPTETSIHSLTGEASLLGVPRWLAAPDGVQNTVMLMELPAKHAIPWTQPEKHDVEPGLSFKDLAGSEKQFGVTMGDGSVFRMSDIPDELFLGLATSNGGELLDAPTIARWSAAKRGEYLVPNTSGSAWVKNQLKQIVLSMLNYESAYRVLPPDRGQRQNGIVPAENYQLSWRVHVLPFIGYGNLYNQFRLAEPWDSPHNRQLLSCMPDCYRDATDSPTSTDTRIMSFTGPGTPYPEPGIAFKFSQITDGISNTIAIFQAPANLTVPWTKPEDFMIDTSNLSNAKLELKKLYNAFGIEVAMMDGSVRSLPPEISAERILALITPNGGEVVASD